jgi:hypothetical protein
MDASEAIAFSALIQVKVITSVELGDREPQ